MVFYRGQGPNSIVVEGFKSGNQCGTGIPPLDVEIYVFLCRADGAWYLNEIAYYTGAIAVNDVNDAIVNKALPDAWLSENSSQLRYQRCRARGEKPIGEADSNQSNSNDRPSSLTYVNQSSSGRECFEQRTTAFREFANSSTYGQFFG